MVEHSTRRVRIFYSWQSDRDRDRCKNFIRKAADEAAARVSERLQVNITVDADTEGIAGTPPISDTILRKIEECDIFLADMTFIAESQNGRKIPNPNVMAEYGYALKCKGLDRILLAMNTSFGSPDELPFDLRHLRHPAQYVVADGVSDSQRRNKRRQFAEVLERNFSTAIENLLTMSPPGAMPPLWDDAQAALERQAALLYAGGAPVVVRVPRLLGSL